MRIQLILFANNLISIFDPFEYICQHIDILDKFSVGLSASRYARNQCSFKRLIILKTDVLFMKVEVLLLKKQT